MVQHHFYFGGRLYSVNDDAMDIFDPSGHIVGNLEDILADLADPVNDRPRTQNKTMTESKSSSSFVPKGSFNDRITKIRQTVKSLSLSQRKR